MSFRRIRKSCAKVRRRIDRTFGIEFLDAGVVGVKNAAHPLTTAHGTARPAVRWPLNQIVPDTLMIPFRAIVVSEFSYALQCYVEDGRVAIDNNRAENQLRVVAVGRKNWLFAGSFDGATRAVLLYSLVQSCTLIGISPFTYLKDVLLRVATHPQQRLDQLTPPGWAATFGLPATA